MTTTEQPLPLTNGEEWATAFMAALREEMRQTGETFSDLDWRQAEACAEFCRTNNCYANLSREQTVNLWGFGTVRPIFYSFERGEAWIRLWELAEPTGIGNPQLYELWRQELDADGIGATGYFIPTENAAADTMPAPLVSIIFAMRMFMAYSPWGAEFAANTADFMSHALLHSGLAQKLDGAQTYDKRIDVDGNQCS
ncbi:hypothetical protein GQF42_16005 [Streptomyces broussonetiae]|uniref:Uncharacterized protein n=1 Tax=Streptomyces broussonetiae TaxID=2686304 RepID=A0A6I6MZN8_9ACTN|nr:hypothetical protein [Streptomyces broussonetiae]QHA04594.1 hypothetical protein GQF42_16005 [Streptomyces broussonetiae]